MALVRNRYYQHSIRINGRVTTRYYGMGEFGRLLDADHDLIRQEREWDRVEARDRDDEQRRLYEAERDSGAAIQALLGICLVASGFHRQGRHRWRRRRRMGAIQASPGRDDAAVRAEMKRLVKAIAVDRDTAAVERLRALAQEYPQAAARAIYCDLPRHARTILAKNRFAKEDSESERQGLVARMEMLAAELAGEEPSPLRRLLAEMTSYEWAGHWFLAIVTSQGDIFRNEHPRLTGRRNAAVKRVAYLARTLAQIEAAERPRHNIVATQINVNT